MTDPTLFIFQTSVWEDSSHLVFKKISQIAVGAIDHFMAQESRSLLGRVLVWKTASVKCF